MLAAFAERILRIGAAFGSASIWLIAAIVTYDVILRYLGMPTIWALEISTYLMIGAATFGSGLAVARGDHFAVDLLPAALPPRASRWLGRFTIFASFCLLLFVTYGFWKLIELSARLDIKSASLLHVPLVYPQAAVFAGFALMALAFAVKLFSSKD